MVDTNMEKAYVGCELLQPFKIPLSLLGIENRTTLLRKINEVNEFSNTKKDNLLSDIEKLADGIIDETNASLRINISLLYDLQKR